MVYKIKGPLREVKFENDENNVREKRLVSTSYYASQAARLEYQVLVIIIKHTLASQLLFLFLPAS